MKPEDSVGQLRSGKHGPARVADSNCGNCQPLFTNARPGEWSQARWEKENRGRFSDPCNPFKRKNK